MDKYNLKVKQKGIDWAAGSGHLEMVKHLESKGLDLATKNGHVEMVKYIEYIGRKKNHFN